MRTSPSFMAFLYFGVGLAFTYIASQAAVETVWNTTTVILSLVATFNFVVAIRLYSIHLKIQQAKKNDKKN
ncbi:DUF4305 domain-containing protein [Halobacillus fulvus]|nr:DUF4305 domain-containing protein [Halobacillus fulvus]